MNGLHIRIGLLLAFVSVLSAASVVNTYSAVKPLHDTYVLGQTQFSPGSAASMRVIVAKAVSLASSEPVPGAKVAIELRAGDGKRTAVYEGATNQRGTLDASFRIPDLAEGSYTMVVRTQSEFGRDELEREVTLRRAAKILLTTDKPLYQPAQTMHIRALALNEGDLRPVAAEKLILEVEDSKGNKVFKKAGDLSKFGIASADFVLAHEVNMGTYKVRALLGKAQAEKTVEVKRYVLPKFKVEVRTDKKFYLPGETAKGSVQSDYFFGKPVAGGKVTLKASTFDVKFNDFATLDGQTDKNGRYEFELKLPEHFVGQPLEKGDALLKFEVKVKDTADHTETVTKTYNVAKDAIRLAVIPESGKVVPGVENILYVFASYPDGEPAQAAVTLEAGDRTLKGSTDASGIVEFKLTPRGEEMRPPQLRRGRRFGPMPMDEGAPAMDFEVKVSAVDKQGRRASVTKALSAESAKDNILLRLSKAIYEGGERLRGELLTTFGSGTAYLDVVKNRQTLLTQTVELSRGRADFDIPLSDDFFGTLEMHAYKIMPDGQIVRDSKVVYVQPTRDLSITVEPDKGTYRPGEDAVIRFQVTDQRGRSVPSALGLIIVDESVYALQEMQPGLEKAYFTLEKELLEPKYEIEFGPAITFEDMVKVRELEERRQTAAKVLLAKAEPPTKFAWQVNPAQARREKLDERLDKLSAALYDYAQKKPVGQLDPATKRWGYQPDLLTKLVKETDLKRADTLDPWGNPFGLDELGQVRAEVKFDNLSRLLAAQGLNKIYGALAQFKSREERRTKERTDPWTFPDDILDKLVEAKLVKKSDLIDPWGQPYVLTRLDKPNPTHYYTAQLRFYEVRSCGPDMVKGTADDVTNPYEMPLFEHRRRFVAFGRGRMLGADMAVMEGAMPMMAVAREEKAMGAAASAQEAPGAKPVVVREFFPETLLFQPSLITDDRGRAEQRVKMADSITTWRLTASASSLLGLLGSTTKGVTVFQDFFIDIDLPVSLTQGDQVHIPVAVYNYLKSRQRVRLVMDKGDWFQALGDTERTMDIGPGDVTVVYFPIAARQVGAHKLTVTGYGEKMSDAIRREIEVAPDGKEALVTFSGRLAKDVRETILIPDSAIDGASKIFVKVYPGVFSQVVEGVDKILQMPNGCFEQTSSTTYPNILVLDYMKRTRQETPELRMKAEQYINLGYQRLLTFEVQGGGFSWFGDKPANKILTAWGVTEFHDMAKVFEIDENVIRRTQAWLVQQQQQDGSWKPDEHYLHAESWGRIQNSNLLATAYIANALLESAYAGSDKGKRESVKRGLDYLVSKREDARDAYTLAFMLNCLASAATMDAAQPRALDEVIARLLDMKKEKGEHVWWESSVATVTHSHGPSAAIETTALVALGLIKCQREHAVVNKALGWLISQKDPNGTWHGTQATILVFKALLGSLTRQGEKVNAQVAIRVGDREEQIAITPENHDVLRLVDFKDQTRKGKNDVSIRVTGLSAVPGTAQAGEGNVMYQIVGRCYLPWPKFEMPVSPPLSIDVDYDRTSLKKDDTVTCRVRVASNLPGTCKMIMVDLGIPPGFSVLTDGLTAAVEKKTIQRFDMTGRQLMIYLEELTFGKPVEFSYQMKAKYPIRAQSPASTVYKYYNPEESATAKPVEIAVVQ